MEHEELTSEQQTFKPAEKEHILFYEKRARIEHNFAYHPPRPGQQEKYQHIRALAKELAHAIIDVTPDCREQSIALTDLEKCVMMANAAIARHR